jgi:hypothetical protein
MKTRSLLLILVGFGLVLIAARLILPSLQTASDNPPSTPAMGTINPTPGSQTDSGGTATLPPKSLSTPKQSQGENVRNAEVNWALDELPSGDTLQERLAALAQRRGVSLNVLTQQALVQWSNAVSEAAEEINRPIEFYGKAVDENAEPVSGANVSFGCIVFPERQLMTNAVTDSEGMFALTGVSAAALNVRVTKQGYDEVQGTNPSSFEYYSPAGPAFYPDPNNPVVFHLRRSE